MYRYVGERFFEGEIELKCVKSTIMCENRGGKCFYYGEDCDSAHYSNLTINHGPCHAWKRQDGLFVQFKVIKHGSATAKGKAAGEGIEPAEED